MNSESNQIKNITLASMLLALAVVLGTLTKTISIPHLSFITFSFTPALVVFASFALGPIYGGIVGGLADLLPAFLYPTGAYNFLLTIVYVLLGILPWLIRKITRKLPSSFPFVPSVIFLLLTLFGLQIYLFYGTDILDARLSYFGSYVKPVILTISGIIDLLCLIGLVFTQRYYKNKRDLLINLPQPGEICFIAFLTDTLLLVLFKGLAYYLYFIVISSSSYRVSYEVIVSMLCISAPLDIVVIGVIVPWLLIFFDKFKSKK